MRLGFLILALASLCYAEELTEADFHLFVKGKAYQNGRESNYTHGDGKSQLPYDNDFAVSLCRTFNQTLSENVPIKLAWFLCKVEYAHEGEVLVHAWLNKTVLESEKVDYSESCYCDSLLHYFELFAYRQRFRTDSGVYLGQVMNIYSHPPYTHKSPEKRIKLKTVNIHGPIFKNGKPVKYELPFYEPLNGTLCVNTFEAIKHDARLAQAWVRCEVRSAVQNKATLSVSFCKHYLDLHHVDYSSANFSVVIKNVLNEHKPESTTNGYYFKEVEKVYGAMNIWIEGVSYHLGKSYPFSHLEKYPIVPLQDLLANNLCGSNALAFMENEIIWKGWMDCVVRLVKGPKVLSDVWLNSTHLDQAGVSYTSKCFPTFFKHYLKSYARRSNVLADIYRYYTGEVHLIYGHRKNDGI